MSCSRRDRHEPARRWGDRTPEERERARRERERRRYERAGEPIPDHLLEPHERADAAPFEPEPEPAPPSPAPVEPAEPEPVAFFEEPAPAPAARRRPSRPAREPEPPATPPEPSPLQETQQWDVTEAWVDEPAAPRAADPDATQAHETIPSFPSEAVAPTPPPVAPLDPETGEHTGEHEAPIGTRRVSRAHLPHIHRPGRAGGKQRGGGADLPKGRGVRVKRPGEVMGASRRRRSVGPRIVAGVVVVLVLLLLWFVNGIFQPLGGGGDGSGRVVVRIPRGLGRRRRRQAAGGERRDLLELLLQPARDRRRQARRPPLRHVHAQRGHEQRRRARRADGAAAGRESARRS